MGEESWNWLQARHSDLKERAIMAQALVWTGRVLQPAALAVLEGLATVRVTSVGERDD